MMGFEQPKFEVEPPEEHTEVSSQKDEPSNVVEGPWPRREPTETTEELTPDQLVPQGTEEAPREEIERSNVIEGPWPKREEEPAETPEELAPKPKEPEEDEKERHRFAESLEQYKPCEACRGTGHRWFFFPCPMCKGFGSVVASSSQREGYYETDKESDARPTAEANEEKNQL